MATGAWPSRWKQSTLHRLAQGMAEHLMHLLYSAGGYTTGDDAVVRQRLSKPAIATGEDDAG